MLMKQTHFRCIFSEEEKEALRQLRIKRKAKLKPFRKTTSPNDGKNENLLSY